MGRHPPQDAHASLPGRFEMKLKLLLAIILGVVCYPLLLLALSVSAPLALDAVSHSAELTFGKLATVLAILAFSFAAISLFAGCLHSYFERKVERSGFSDNIFQSFIYALFYEFAFTAVSLLFARNTEGGSLSWLIASLILVPFNMLIFLVGKYLFGALYRLKKSVRPR